MLGAEYRNVNKSFLHSKCFFYIFFGLFYVMCDNPLHQWVQSNKGKEGFGDSLVKLLSFACSEWIRRECSVSLTGSDGLSWFLAKGPSKFPLANWVESPEKNAEAIVDFCEMSKTCPIPESLKLDFPKFLDLRGVVCPGNAVRARLVMAGFPAGRPLDFYLDEGSPIENVPGALVADGIKVLSRVKKENYWVLTVVKPENNV